MKHIVKLTFFIALVIVLSSCNNQSAIDKSDENNENISKTKTITSEQKSQDRTNVKLPYDPAEFKRSLTKTEKLMLMQNGSLSGEKYNRSKMHAKLDELSSNMTGKQYYDQLLKLLKEDYTEPVKTLVNYDADIKVQNKGPNEDIENENMSAEDLEYVIMLDSSGSMAGEVNGQTKMDIAKRSINEFASNLPQESEISLRAYGLEGTNQSKDKKMSCNSFGELYNGQYKRQVFTQSLKDIQPAGWTPIAAALSSIKGDMGTGKKVIVYIVSDGIETCGGDPVQSVKELKQSGIDVSVNIISFDIEDRGRKLLKKISDEGNGQFKNITSQEDLDKYLRQQNEMLRYQWSSWKDEGVKESVRESDNKRLEVLDVENQIKEIANAEYKNLTEAQEYLRDHSSRNEEAMNKLSDLINARYGEITSYARKTSEKIRNNISASGSEKINDYTEKGNQKVEEYLQ
ncbi:vWA domain-containing protein [Priestia megaterium]|uniref:vWA domain-containing protein n=1 Tax=Priestia megaterium TaxID=1404 RepID=UPI0012B7B58A|nr:VWA domain-containing protein [Priestia megaterium]